MNDFLIVVLQSHLADCFVTMNLNSIYTLPLVLPDLNLNFDIKNCYNAITPYGEYVTLHSKEDTTICMTTQGHIYHFNTVLYLCDDIDKGLLVISVVAMKKIQIRSLVKIHYIQMCHHFLDYPGFQHLRSLLPYHIDSC